MRFKDRFGRIVDWEKGFGLSGDEELVAAVNQVIEDGASCDCDFWAPVTASLDSDWEAYLTICSAITRATLEEPEVDQVPENPAGYEPEGPRG